MFCNYYSKSDEFAILIISPVFAFMKVTEILSTGEEEIRLFVYREENWDFCVLPAARRNGVLSLGEVSRFLFDDNSVDYFCGLF